MKNILYKRAESRCELQGILDLQKRNSRYTVPESEKTIEGFVTVEHDMEILKKMNDCCAHCIAKLDNKVIGYALSMHREFKDDIPLLIPMFLEIDEALRAQKLHLNYIAMGQVCVDKSFRGQGIFRGLYQFMALELKTEFDAIITEVDSANVRSSRAHKAVGFELMKKYALNDQLWEVIMLRT